MNRRYRACRCRRTCRGRSRPRRERSLAQSSPGRMRRTAARIQRIQRTLSSQGRKRRRPSRRSCRSRCRCRACRRVGTPCSLRPRTRPCRARIWSPCGPPPAPPRSSISSAQVGSSSCAGEEGPTTDVLDGAPPVITSTITPPPSVRKRMRPSTPPTRKMASPMEQALAAGPPQLSSLGLEGISGAGGSKSSTLRVHSATATGYHCVPGSQ